MKTAIGPIFRLNRNEKKIKIKQISKALDISQSKISNFENERTTLSEKQIRELYLFIGFEYNNHNMDDLMKKIRFSVLSIYNCICYEKKDIAQNEKRECIQDIKKDNAKNTVQDKDIKINGKEEIIQDIMNDLKNDVTQNKKEDTI